LRLFSFSFPNTFKPSTSRLSNRAGKKVYNTSIYQCSHIPGKRRDSPHHNRIPASTTPSNKVDTAARATMLTPLASCARATALQRPHHTMMSETTPTNELCSSLLIIATFGLGLQPFLATRFVEPNCYGRGDSVTRIFHRLSMARKPPSITGSAPPPPPFPNYYYKPPIKVFPPITSPTKA
jgi:hypothetical protein